MSNLHNYSQQIMSADQDTMPDEENEDISVDENDFDTLLIRKVKQFPAIYNKKKCKDPTSEAQAWVRVADELSAEVATCQRRLQRLREYYSRERQNRERGIRKKNFGLFEMMDFMGPYIYRRKKKSMKKVPNYDNRQDDSTNYDTSGYYNNRNNSYVISDQDDTEGSPMKATFSYGDFVAVDLDGNISYLEEELIEGKKTK